MSNKKTTCKSPVCPPSSEERKAFFKTQKYRDALGEGPVRKPSVDLDHAENIVLEAAERVAALREDIAEHAPTFRLKYIDDLGSLARAAVHAQVVLRRYSVQRKDEISKLRQTRQRLTAALHSLEAAGFVPEGTSGALSGGRSRSAVVADVRGIIAAFQDFWAEIHDKSWVTAKHLKEASELVRIVKFGRTREIDEATDDLTRAMAAMVDVYDQVRNVVRYVRSEERDATDFAPSLYRRTRRAANEDEPPVEGSSSDSASDSADTTQPVLSSAPTPVAPSEGAPSEVTPSVVTPAEVTAPVETAVDEVASPVVVADIGTEPEPVPAPASEVVDVGGEEPAAA